MMKKSLGLVAVLMMAFVLAACGGAAPAGDSGSPEASAKGFVEATFSGNIEAAKTFACTAALAQLTDESAAAMSAMADAEVDFSGLTYTVSDATDTTANVTVGGIMKMTLAGTTQDLDFATMGDSAKFPMVKENGVWKACPAS